MKRKVVIAGVITDILVMLSCLLVLINQPVNNLDELWNYNFSRCMYKGMFPYRDFSMITMPLSPLLVSLVMHVFGDNLIIYRLSGVVLYVLIATVIYNIFNKFLDSRYIISACFTVMIMMLILSDYRYDYNYMNMLLILIIMLISSCYADSYKQAMLLGVLSGLTICVKQTTGMCVIAANIIVSYIMYRKSEYNIWKAVVRCVAGIIPGMILAGYIIMTGLMADFIQYCIKGVATFNNKISYIQFSLSSPFNMVMGIIFPLIIIWLIYKSVIMKSLHIISCLIYAFVLSSFYR